MDAAALVDHEPREIGGPTQFRGSDFQLHFSMSMVLALHAEGKEFTAVFDHVDDLVLIIGPADNCEISFYQVKSKVGTAWTIKRLANRPKNGDLPRSIIGKAYYNIHQFGAGIRRASIISNQPINAKYTDGTKVKADDGEIAVGLLSKEDQDVIATTLAADFPEGVNAAYTTLLTYERTPLDPMSFRKTLLGEVTDFACKVDSDGTAAPKPIYDALLSEIGRCTGDTSRPKTLDELKSRKSLGRCDVNALVERVQQRPKNVLEWWDAVAAELTMAEMGAIKLQRLRGRCLSYWRERERGSMEAIKYSEELKRHLDEYCYLIGDKIETTASALILANAPKAPKNVTFDQCAALIVEVMERSK